MSAPYPQEKGGKGGHKGQPYVEQWGADVYTTGGGKGTKLPQN